MLHSFGRDFRPWSAYALRIKAELERQSQWPLELQEHTLLTARFHDPGPEAPLVDYLRSLYTDRPPDIVLSIGRLRPDLSRNIARSSSLKHPWC